ncbi:hypothetical protein GCM10022222_05580 [Amycolatopsis ultiminotia]|uniref:Uncharacterized protein n=1 Tax=Amycolatopsis ultiminotia TaxID=543629 RepID=A0ABP6V3L3_9PSEU
MQESEPTTLHRDPEALTAAVATSGRAAGHLVGGHLGAVAGFVGAGLPCLDGAILFLESPRAIGWDSSTGS